MDFPRLERHAATYNKAFLAREMNIALAVCGCACGIKMPVLRGETEVANQASFSGLIEVMGKD